MKISGKKSRVKNPGRTVVRTEEATMPKIKAERLEEIGRALFIAAGI